MTRGIEFFTEDLSLWPQLRLLDSDLFARLERFFFIDNAGISVILWTRDECAYYVCVLDEGLVLIEIPEWRNAIQVTCIQLDSLDVCLIMVLTKSHLVWCSILTNSIQLPELTPLTLFATGIQKLSRGYATDVFAHLLALDIDGGVWAWGDNSWGQLGLGHQELMLTDGLSRVESLIGKRIVDIQAQNKTSLAFTDRNEIYLWGKVGESTVWTVPRRISTPPEVISYGLVATLYMVFLDVTTLSGQHYRSIGPFFGDTWQLVLCGEKIVKVLHMEEHNDNQCLVLQTQSGRFIGDFFHVKIAISHPGGSLIDSVGHHTTLGIVTLTEPSRRQVFLFNDPLSTDLILQVGSSVINVHRSVICSKSPFLSKLLQEHSQKVLVLEDFHFSEVYQYIRFLYSDQSTDLRRLFSMLAFAMNDPNLRRRLICMITQQMIHFYRHFGWNSVAQYLWINRFARAKPIYDQQRTQPDDTLSARVVRYLFQNIHRINFSIFQLEE